MSIKFEHTEVVGWEAVIRGMRNPMNSWEKSDSEIVCSGHCNDDTGCIGCKNICYKIGQNDHDLMMRLRNAGTDHRKFMRMIVVYVDITAPLYWWKEFDTYKVGTVANSCSTMHKIHAKEFTLEDFAHEHLTPRSLILLKLTIHELNRWRDIYLNGCPAAYGCPARHQNPEIKPKDKDIWWQMIQLLPSNYNQKRTVMMNYEVLANIYKSRKYHKLDEWKEHIDELHYGFCDWIKTLPYSELITEEEK